MKKIQKGIIGILAIAMLTPTVLIACKAPNPEAERPPSSNVDSSIETEPPDTESTETPPVAETPPAPVTAQYLRCTGDSVYFRKGAGTNFAKAGSAKKGETYAIIGQVGNWYETYYRGEKVYVSASYAAVMSMEKHDSEEVEQVLQEGYKLLGVPYVYGAVRFHNGNGKLLSGFSAQKFDCSSLVQYVFYKGADTLLQVTTRTQVVQGRYVGKNNLQRGDCIYFTNSSRQHLTGVERVGHVAIYLGNNYILHTASDYARIEPISATRWKYYIEARRFV